MRVDWSLDFIQNCIDSEIVSIPEVAFVVLLSYHIWEKRGMG